jgi:hypothetical protein
MFDNVYTAATASKVSTNHNHMVKYIYIYTKLYPVLVTSVSPIPEITLIYVYKKCIYLDIFSIPDNNPMDSSS